MKTYSSIYLSRDLILHPSMPPLWDGLNLGVTVTDENARILYMNGVQKKIDGFDRIKVIGTKMQDLYFAEGEQSITQSCLSGGKPIINKLWAYRTKANKLNQTIHTLFPLFDQDGTLNGTIIFVTEYYQFQQDFSQLLDNEGKNTGKIQGKKLITFNDIVGNDPQFNTALDRAKGASHSDAPVMICGESGTGKNLVAQAIHMEGKGKDKSYTPINCAAIPEHLLEVMMFGTAQGAFTGATEKMGLFEAAQGGTILLDEVNAMPADLQAKLLRVLQEKKIRKMGSLEEIPFNAKIICTMNIPPVEALEKKQVRPDLFYRLAMVILEIPPLRKRKLDIPPLCEFFLKQNKKKFKNRKLRLASDVYTQLFDYNWPGNVRELEHVISSALQNLGKSSVIELYHLNAYFHDAVTKANEKETQKQKEGLSAVEFVKYVEELYFRKAQEKEGTTAAPPIPTADRTGIQRLTDEVQQALAGGTKIDLREKLKRFERLIIQEAISQSDNNVSRAGKQLGLSPSAIHYKLGSLGIKLPPA